MRIIKWAVVALALTLSPLVLAADFVTATAVNLTNSKLSLDINVEPGGDIEAYRVSLAPGGSAVLPVSLQSLRADSGLQTLIDRGLLRVDLTGGIPTETWEFTVEAGGDADTNLVARMPYRAKLLGATIDVTTAGAGGSTALLLTDTTTVSASIDTSADAVIEVGPSDLSLQLARDEPLVLRRSDTDAAVTVRVSLRATSL